MRYQLTEIERFPAQIEPGVLYYSQEFKMCAHRCACGCGDVIQLPVDNQNYRITVGAKGVTLRPSIGNWNVCDAHYYITDGGVEWMPTWSAEQVAAGRAAEDARRDNYYARKATWSKRIKLWLVSLLSWFRRG
ncbi:hypothetical protein KNJ79_02675 [Sphingopyxis indica]|uniref:DUF6527 family protein n=1 Tax=Sphingopyxis indica TaxID=436663 RepID=UPI00293911ED|nr:DUF6527 family protein [Sphingopyxis indica]WOF43878.1 hypothetical protein KNJ79_02675 [Sphingopyxis indica]